MLYNQVRQQKQFILLAFAISIMLVTACNANAPATQNPTSAPTATPDIGKGTSDSPFDLNAPALASPTPRPNTPTPKPVVEKPRQVYLFLDDQWIESHSNLTREVMSPQRFLQEPVVTSAPGFRAWQPFLTVLYDPQRKGTPFRMWYNAYEERSERGMPTDLAYIESQDGIQWKGPYRRLDVPNISVNASLIDQGPDFKPADRRYRIAYYTLPHDFPDTRLGMKYAYSPDGLVWTPGADNAFAADTDPLDDIWNVFYDPLRKRYGVFFKMWREHVWKNAQGDRVGRILRLVGYSTSHDFENWSQPQIAIQPKPTDPVNIQWYGVGGVHRRGNLLLGFLKVLRDDLSPEGVPARSIQAATGGAGIGWTNLIWSYDGETWMRDDTPFFEPNPTVGTWDHAVAWIDSAVSVKDEVYLYYGGYQWGHKSSPQTERQIGMVKLARDRYVARTAGEEEGRLRLRYTILDAKQVTLNVNAANGSVQVRLIDKAGTPIPGFTFAQCEPITIDAVAAPLKCQGSFKELQGKSVQFEFALKNAQLFAVELQ